VTSVRATVVVAVILALPIPIASWAAARVAEVPAGVELSLPFRITLAASNWYVRLLPIASLVILSVTAAVAAALSRVSGTAERRRALLVWTCIAALDWVSFALVSWVPFSLMSRLVPISMILMALGIVATVAAVATAAIVQGEMWKTGATSVRSWHVAAIGFVLFVLGPLALLPPVWVLVRSSVAAPEVTPT